MCVIAADEIDIQTVSSKARMIIKRGITASRETIELNISSPVSTRVLISTSVLISRQARCPGLAAGDELFTGASWLADFSAMPRKVAKKSISAPRYSAPVLVSYPAVPDMRHVLTAPGELKSGNYFY